MISVLRNNLKDGGMTTIVWIAVGSMIIGSAVPLFMKKNSDTWALKVNGTEIPYTTYAAELALARDYINMLRSQYGQFADYLLQSMGIYDPQSMTVQQLISSQLMVDGYVKQGIVVSPVTISSKMSDKDFIEKQCSDLLPSFLYKNNALDKNLMKVYLQRRNMTIEQLETRLQERIGSVFMREALRGLGYIPKLSMAEALEKDALTKDILVIRFPLDIFKKKISSDIITSEELQKFYDQENAHARRYYTPEKRSGFQIRFKADNYGIALDDTVIENYYEEHKISRYTQEPGKVQVRAIACSTEQEAAAVRSEILNNKNMLSFVKQYPFDEESDRNNGLLNPIIRGTGDRIIEKAAFILAADGDISPVLTHKNRFIILERVSKTAPIIKSLATVKDEIVTTLTVERFKETCIQDLKAIVEMPSDIAAFTKKHNGVRSSVSLIQEDANTELGKALFSLEPRTYKSVVQGNDCYLVYLDAIIPSEVQAFEEIQDQIRTDLIINKAEQALERAYNDFIQKIQTDTVRDKASELGYATKEYSRIKSTDNTQNTDLRKEGIDIGLLNKLEKPGTFTTINDKNEKKLIFLKNTSLNQEVTTDSTKNKVKTTILKQETDCINNAYIASLYRDAKIEKNDILALLDEENAI